MMSSFTEAWACQLNVELYSLEDIDFTATLRERPSEKVEL